MKFTGERFIPNQIESSDPMYYEHINRYHSIQGLIANKRVLDAACGTGYGSKILSSFALDVIGIDIDNEAVEYATTTYHAGNISFQKASVEELPFQDYTFDVVVSFETIEHVDEETQMTFLNEVKRVLNADGKFIVSTPDKAIYSDLEQYKNDYHVKEFYTQEFYNFLKSHFKYVYFLYQRNEICNIISGFECDTINVIRKKFSDSNKGKYIIAICSDIEVHTSDMTCASIQIQTGEFESKINRIIDLQNEIVEKNQWAFSLDQEVADLRGVIQEERKMYSDLREEILERDEIITNERSGRDILAEALEKLQIQLEEKAIEYQSIRDEQDNLINQLRNDFAFVQETLDAKSKESEQLREEIQTYNTLIDQERAEHTIVNNTMVEALEKLQIQLEENDKKNIILEKQLELMKYNSEKNYIKANNHEAFSHLRAKYKKEITDRFMDNFLKSKNIFLKPFKTINLIVRFKKDLEQIDTRFNQVPREFLEQFDSGKYLEANEDVKYAVEHNQFENAVEHFIFYGFEEVRGGVRSIYNSVGLFQENEYLRSYADVDAAVKRGDFKTAYDHFLRFGCFEISRGSRIKHHLSSLEDYKPILIDPQSVVISYNTIVNVPLFTEPLVSIIVPAYNQANYTVACIQSIVANTTTVSYEIILMDDKSSDADARNLKYFIHNITFVSNEENLGFLRNCNKGAALARGKYILFLNNDTNVQPNWLDSLVDLIESDDSIGMVGSRLVYPDGRQQEAGGIIWNDASGWNFGRLDDPSKPEYNYVKEVDYISGASIMLSKALWEEIGGFDERYVPAYCEDSDLAFEVRRHGYKVMYQPKSVVVHFEGISNGTDLGSGIKSYQVKNKDKFIEKWKVELGKQFENGQNVFNARDRSQDKSSILIIDHYVPHFDQDAGSRTVFAYIKLFVEQGFNVKFIGDNFYAHQPYTEVLQHFGVEVLYGEWFANNWIEWLKANGHYLQYVLLNRPHISEKYIDQVRMLTKAKIFYYGHDLHSLRDTREYLLTGDNQKLESADFWRDKEFELMRKADMSFYPSQVEIDEIKSIDPGINVQTMPAYLFTEFVNKKRNIQNTKNIMFVGGFNHQPNVDAVLWFVNHVWPEIKKELNIKLFIIGSKPTEQIKLLKSNDIIVTGFISDEELTNYYQTTRIVIVPLRYGAGIKGKVVEALYEQIPIVTTLVGSEGLVGASEYMVIADGENDFAEAVINLYKDANRLNDLSSKSLQYCKQFFSYNAAIKVLSTSIKFDS